MACAQDKDKGKVLAVFQKSKPGNQLAEYVLSLP
jgi:hypothetical protein